MTLQWTADNLDLNDNISIKWQFSNTSELHLQCCSWLNVPGFTPPLGEIPLSEHACDASASSRWSCRMCLSDNTWHFKTLLPQYQSMNQVVCVEHCSSAVYKNRYVKCCAPLFIIFLVINQHKLIEYKPALWIAFTNSISISLYLICKRNKL